MADFSPAAIAYQRRRWERADAYRFAAPGTPEAKMPGYRHPWAAVARAEEAKAAADWAEQEALRADLEQLHRLVKDLRIDLALRRLCHKYSPDQPRVPAGSGRESGRWTDGGGSGAVRSQSADVERIRLAGDITGFTRHGMYRAMQRGISPSAMQDAVVSPLQIIPQANGNTQYVGRDAVVVLNPLGQVVTVWSSR